MFLQRSISFKVILQFAWKVQLYAFLVSLFVFLLYAVFKVKAIAIPFLPVATIGTAVAFYVGFKNNSAYDGFGRPAESGEALPMQAACGLQW